MPIISWSPARSILREGHYKEVAMQLLQGAVSHGGTLAEQLLGFRYGVHEERCLPAVSDAALQGKYSPPIGQTKQGGFGHQVHNTVDCVLWLRQVFQKAHADGVIEGLR